MIVDRDKCIGCTLCKQDCIVSDIEMIDKKSEHKKLNMHKMWSMYSNLSSKSSIL